jgi:hypothetical protein
VHIPEIVRPPVIQALSSVIKRPELRGRWSVDVGNFGPEGWPLLWNLFALAGAARAGTSGAGAASGKTGKYGSVAGDGNDLFFQGSIGSGVWAPSGS